MQIKLAEVEQFNYLSSIITNEDRCIKKYRLKKTDMAKITCSEEKVHLNFSLRKDYWITMPGACHCIEHTLGQFNLEKQIIC